MTRSLALRIVILFASLLIAEQSGAVTYYVSSVSGNDSNNGTSPATPFKTVARVGNLALAPGDEVRFFCGETWRADPLVIVRSGAAGSPILFGSYPAGCQDKPLLSGAVPIAGFYPVGQNLYAADLSAGANAGKFPSGINQLFRAGVRLPFGRWPDIAGRADGGYAEVDSQPSLRQIVDAELPQGNWTGAIMHIKGIRWYMLNRIVTSSSPSILGFAEDVICVGGCAKWGYFLNNHLATLSTEGEWFHNAAQNRVYLYSTKGTPKDNDLEGSAILAANGTQHGGIILGNNLREEIAYVTIENLRIERWFDSGITTPINLEVDENRNITIRDCEIRDVDADGIRMRTWVWNAAANGNGPNGWRGGRNLLMERNLIERANEYGIDFAGRQSQIADNTIRDIGRVENLGATGLGCGVTGTNCTESGAGIRLPLDSGAPNHTANQNQILRNRIERVGMNGIDLFGWQNTIRNNIIDEACITKGDCGGIRTFGRNDLTSTYVHDVTIDGNIIRHTIGNTDGCAPAFEPLFGLGIYIDNFSRNVTVTNNTIIGSTWVGLLFQRSTGTASNNTLYDNVVTDWGSQFDLRGSQTVVASNGNIFYSMAKRRFTMTLDSRANLSSSDQSYFFSPWDDASIVSDDAGAVPMTLTSWRAFSGRDGASKPHWFNQAAGEATRSRLLVNTSGVAKTFSLGPASFLDLDQAPVGTSVTVSPYSSRVLVAGLVPPSKTHDLIVGEGHGAPNENRVRIFAGNGGATTVDFLAYAAGAYGTGVGSGNIDGAGNAEILTGPGPGPIFGPQVRAFDRTGSPVAKVNYFAYGTLRYGVNAAGGDIDADGFGEILSGAGRGAVFGPHVRGWNYDGSRVSSMPKVNYFAYQTLKWGVNVAAGDVDGDTFREILTGPGPGQIFGAQVRGWNFDAASLSSIARINFLPYTTQYGAHVAAGDIEFDGFDELATAPGAGATNGAMFRGFDYDDSAILPISLYDLSLQGGQLYGGRLALGDFGNNWNADLAAAPGPDPAASASVEIYVYDGFQSKALGITAFQAAYGTNVAAGKMGY